MFDPPCIAINLQRQEQEDRKEKALKLIQGEDRLKRIEEEVIKHKKKLEDRKKEENERIERKIRQEEKKKRWEMLRWIVSYIEEKKPEWDRRRIEQVNKKKILDRKDEERLKLKPVIEPSREEKDERRSLKNSSVYHVSVRGDIIVCVRA